MTLDLGSWISNGNIIMYRPHTITTLNDNINMESTIAGSMGDNINMESTIAGSMNDNINMESTIAGSMYACS